MLGDVEVTLIPEFAYNAYQKMMPYIIKFLCSQHPYRKGKLCPFVPKAIKENCIYFTYFDGSLVESINFIKNCIDFFLKKKRAQNTLGALIILFPEDFSLETLLEIHLKSKVECVKNNIMIGALYSTSQAQSLHCESFYPLRTPVPTLVLRDLVIHDLIFLNPKHYKLHERLNFLNSFIKKFDKDFKYSSAKSQINNAMILRKELKTKINIYKYCKYLAIAVNFIILTVICIKFKQPPYAN